MDDKCPGQDTRTLKQEDIEEKCPHCGEIVEIWPPEKGVKCHKCGSWVSKEIPNCADWCPGGEELVKKCLGEKRYKEWKESKKKKRE